MPPPRRLRRKERVVDDLVADDANSADIARAVDDVATARGTLDDARREKKATMVRRELR